MPFEEIKPSGYLKNFIECYWHIYTHEDGYGEEDVWLPDGTFDMIFCLGNPYLRASKEITEKISGSVLIMPMTEARTIKFSNKTNLIGIRLKPLSLYPLIKTRCCDLTNKTILLSDILENNYSPLFSAVYEKPFAQSIPFIEKILWNYFENYHCKAILSEGIHFIIKNRGNISIEQLCANLRISKTSLDKDFTNFIGISPKFFAKICRLQYCISLKLNKPYHTLTKIAYESEYYDQSHFIKDFKAVAGISPKNYFKINSTLKEYLARNANNRFNSQASCHW